MNGGKKGGARLSSVSEPPLSSNETASHIQYVAFSRLATSQSSTTMSFATRNAFLPTNARDERGATSSPAVARAPPANGQNVTQTVNHNTARPWGATPEKMAILASESLPHMYSDAFARYVLTWTVLILAPQAVVFATSTERCV